MNYLKKCIEININGHLLEINKKTTTTHIIRTTIVSLLILLACYFTETPLFVLIVFGIGSIILLGYHLKKDTVEINFNKSIIKRYSTILSKEFKYDFNLKYTEPLVIYSKADNSDGFNCEFYIYKNNKKYSLFMSQEKESLEIIRGYFHNNEIIFNSNKIRLEEK